MANSSLSSSQVRGRPRFVEIALFTLSFILPVSVVGDPAPVTTLRSREIELHYRLTGAAPDSIVEVWFTRDRGLTWQAAGKDEDRTSPALFTAPGEGLYGFILVVHTPSGPSRPAPTAHESAQKWVFIDATPPLAQWDQVEPADDFATTRNLQLHWTAHDDHLGARPICLSYQSTIDQTWHTIDAATANTGRYDWKLPETIAGQITLKLTVRDQGGHGVERIFGPVAVDRFASRALRTTAVAAKATGTSPEPGNADIRDGVAAASAPAGPVGVDLLKQRMAADLYRQGSWHLVRGQYAVAAERLGEALQQDPDLLDARQDLAGIFYRQQDYDRAISEYESILSRNDRYESALYGAALAYVAKKDYHQSRDKLTRLLQVNDRNAEAWLDLGDVLFMMGDVVNARGHWRRALKLDPNAAEVVAKAQRRLDLYGNSDEIKNVVADSRQVADHRK